MLKKDMKYLTPEITIIINCFNGEGFLEEAIDSVLLQTYQNWELIFWDNQSTDDSSVIFNKYEDPRFSYYYAEKHTTLGEARNLSVQKSKGNWISFLDCDDFWTSDKLEKQMKLVDDDVDGLLGFVYGNTQSFWEGGDRESYTTLDIHDYKKLPEGDVFYDLCENNFVSLVSGLIRKKSFEAVGGFNNSFKQSEDFEIFLKISKSFLVGAVSDVCCYYRRHDSNLSNSQKQLSFTEGIEVLSYYCDDPKVTKCISVWRAEYVIWALFSSKWDVFIEQISYVSFWDIASVVKRIILRNIRPVANRFLLK